MPSGDIENKIFFRQLFQSVKQILANLGKNTLPAFLQTLVILPVLSDIFYPDVAHGRRGDQISVFFGNHAAGNKALQEGVGIFDKRKIIFVSQFTKIIAMIHFRIFFKLQIDEVAETVSNPADETACCFARVNIATGQLIQKDIQNVLDDILAFHSRAYPTSIVIGARQRGREKGYEERGKLAVNDALPVKTDQLVEDDVFRLDVAACVMEEPDQLLMGGEIRNNGKVRVQYVVKSPEAFRGQRPANPGERKTHASNTAWAS